MNKSLVFNKVNLMFSKFGLFIKDQSLKINFFRLIDLYATFYKELYYDASNFFIRFEVQINKLVLIWTEVICDGIVKSEEFLKSNPEMRDELMRLRKKYRELVDEINKIK